MNSTTISTDRPYGTDAPTLNLLSRGSSLDSAQSQATQIQDCSHHTPTLFPSPKCGLPVVGQTAFGFRLIDELGEGAFGRVYLATQAELGERPVVLKVSADLTGEVQALARLQHTNIVPLYSVHREGAYQAVCMPYFGSVTVSKLLRSIQNDGLPQSGRDLVDRIHQISRIDSVPPTEHTAMLASMSYPQAICWLMARIADGLAHAHDRDYLHRDIKPGNILITDEGQPMLLDFGVAEELGQRASSLFKMIGGTMPYMAPEQLTEVRTGKIVADPRCDLYSLGLVFFELLTGRYPFEERGQSSESTTKSQNEIVECILTERFEKCISLRSSNPEITPGLESIVLTCLSNDPNRRFPSAAALSHDLERYLSDQPLAIAPEKSYRERMSKFARRHPRFASWGSMAAIAMTAIAIVCGVYYIQHDRLLRFESAKLYRQVNDELRASQFLLYAGIADQERLDQGMARTREAMSSFGFLDGHVFEDNAHFVRLTQEQQTQLKQNIAEGCLLMAQGHRMKYRKSKEYCDLKESINYIRYSEHLTEDDPPPALYRQKAKSFRLAGRIEEADAANERLKIVPLRTARDFYTSAVEMIATGQMIQAVEHFRVAQTLDPQLFWPYFGEGVALAELKRFQEARGAYTAAIAIWPDFEGTYFNRSLVSKELHQFHEALADLNKAIKMNPHHRDSYLARADVYRLMKQSDKGLADLQVADAKGVPPEQTKMLRELLLAGTKPPQEKQKDLVYWTDRGQQMFSSDRLASLESFEEALQLEPHHIYSLLCKAQLLCLLNREIESIELLTHVLAIEPRNDRAMALRAVVNSRTKHWKDAIADAKASIAINPTAENIYIVAGVYARLTEFEPAYQAEALMYLGIALRAGFGFDQLDSDPELDDIRHLPEFEAMVKSFDGKP